MPKFDDGDAALDSLVTGNRGSATMAPSRMFANENLNDDNPAVKQKQADAERLAVALFPWAEEILKEINKHRKELDSVGSYLQRIYAENDAPKVTAEQIEAEFRGREIALQTLDKLETWVLRNSRRKA